MNDLSQIIRLRRWQLDEKRRALTDLETLSDRLAEDARRLEAELRAEQQAASQDEAARAAYAAYAREVIARRQRIEQSRQAVETQIGAARDEVREAFSEIKKYEQLQALRERRQKAERTRREQAAFDEVALETHRRRQAKS